MKRSSPRHRPCRVGAPDGNAVRRRGPESSRRWRGSWACLVLAIPGAIPTGAPASAELMPPDCQESAPRPARTASAIRWPRPGRPDRLDGADPPSVDAVPNARRRRAAVPGWPAHCACRKPRGGAGTEIPKPYGVFRYRDVSRGSRTAMVVAASGHPRGARQHVGCGLPSYTSTAAHARSRSAQRSSTASMPTLKRRREGGRCSCPGTLARRSMVDSTAPRLVAC